MTRLQSDPCFQLRQKSLGINSELNNLYSDETSILSDRAEFERLIQANEAEIRRASFEIFTCKQPSSQSRQNRRLNDFVLDGSDLLRCLENARRLNRRIAELQGGIRELERRIRRADQDLADIRHKIRQRTRLQDQYRDQMRDHGCPHSL